MVTAKPMLLSATELDEAIRRHAAVVVDCRFNLLDAQAGRAAWEAGHIPGAFYADLDSDLAAPRRPDSGRHPLPDPAAFAALLGSWGVAADSLIVAYDDVGGAVAARLWWLCRWAGHERVALLDGGLPAWKAAELPLSTAVPATATAEYPVSSGAMPVIDASAVQTALEAGRLTLIDARDAARFAGKAEPIDPRAGHVPGALNRPFSCNLDATGCFKPAAQLRAEFTALLDGEPAAVASMCGSGVTACHNLFAMTLAGLPPASLYVGSWSGWITDPARPVAID